MGHGGWFLGSEHGGWVLEDGVTWGVLATVTAVRCPLASDAVSRAGSVVTRCPTCCAGVLGDMLRSSCQRHSVFFGPVHQQLEIHVSWEGHQV